MAQWNCNLSPTLTISPTPRLLQTIHRNCVRRSLSWGRHCLAAGTPLDDILRYRIALAAKYNNGRFFFNGEADWFNRWRSGRGTVESDSKLRWTAHLVKQNEDDQAWLYGAEIGALCGPSKVTFNYVRATGDDTSTRNTSEDAAVAEQSISAPYMKPWGYLMYYMYGTGDGWDASGNGQPTNFHHVGGRLDYAIAANLNTFVVFSKAWRDQASAYTLGGDYRIGGRPFTNNDIAAATRHVEALTLPLGTLE